MIVLIKKLIVKSYMLGNKINIVMYYIATRTHPHTHTTDIYLLFIEYNDQVNCDNDKKNIRFYHNCVGSYNSCVNNLL